jgi:hypothetical protein
MLRKSAIIICIITGGKHFVGKIAVMGILSAYIHKHNAIFAVAVRRPLATKKKIALSSSGPKSC